MDPNFNTDPGLSAAVSALWGGLKPNPGLMAAIAGSGGAVLSASSLFATPGVAGKGLADYGIAEIPDSAFLTDMPRLAEPENEDEGFSLAF